MEKTDERLYEAELWRIKGELSLAGAGEEERQKAKGKAQKSKIPNPQSLIPNPASEAEACFRKAIAVARQQQAKSLELRAVMSLVKLRQQQALEQRAKGRAVRAGHSEQGIDTALADAHLMLSKVYNWFTEGFDTKDLQEAKALLNTLAASSPA
jgi:hypothetical protein